MKRGVHWINPNEREVESSQKVNKQPDMQRNRGRSLNQGAPTVTHRINSDE